MKLYLVRHAQAIERGSPGLIDEDRPLVRKGRDRMLEVAKAFRQSEHPLDRMLTSPLVRAVQTAEILAWGAGFRGEVEVTRCLAPSASPEDLDQLLAYAPDCRGMALVGHEPTMSEFARHLLGRTDFPEFKKGAVCVIELPKGPSHRPAKFGGMLMPKSLEWLREVRNLSG